MKSGSEFQEDRVSDIAKSITFWDIAEALELTLVHSIYKKRNCDGQHDQTIQLFSDVFIIRQR